MSDPSAPGSDKSINRKPQPRLLRFLTLILGRFLPSHHRKAEAQPRLNSSPDPARGPEMAAGEKSGAEEAAGMRRPVKQLHFGGQEEKAAGAAEIKRLARADPRARRMLAELGVIPSLVAMLDESPEEDDRCRLVVEALIELANGTFTNKMLMVEAGLLAKLPRLTTTQDLSRKQELMFLLLSISSLVRIQFHVAPRHILPFITKTLNANEIVDDAKMASLATLYNLSAKLENTKSIVASGVVHALLTLAPNRRASEGALATLGHLVPTAVGKKAIEDDSLVPKVFIDILAWDDKPRCQELAGYVLMVLAHRSATQRRKMAGLGIVPPLLEVALLGSPLAQKRALKILQWYKAEGQARMRVHSGPQEERVALPRGTIDGGEAKERRRAIKRMVRQSLDKNMESILRRANASEDFSNLKPLAVSCSSKSLPY